METFVVRIYPGDQLDDGQVNRIELRGVASHVASGRGLSFHSAEALIAFLVDPQRGEGIGGEAPAGG